MKKMWILIVLAVFLTGCGGTQDFETMQDVYAPQDPADPMEVSLLIPEDASASAIESSTGTIYFCDGYDMALETMISGDIYATIRTLTGYEKDELTVFRTQSGGVTRYECAWVCAGESGDQVGRLAIFDDGSYHYCLTVMALAEEAGSLHQTWGELFESFSLVSS